jgi:hypothetical protein
MATNREIPIRTNQTDSAKCSNDIWDYRAAVIKGKEAQAGGSTRYTLTGNPDSPFAVRAFNCFQNTETWEIDLYFLMASHVLLRINRQISERNLSLLLPITDRWHWFLYPKKKESISYTIRRYRTAWWRVSSSGKYGLVIPWKPTEFTRNIASIHRVQSKASEKPGNKQQLVAMKMEAICSCESSFNFQRTTRYIPEVWHPCENLKSNITWLEFFIFCKMVSTMH